MCWYVTPDNRSDNGKFFVRQNCNYSEHADTVEAIDTTLSEFVKDQEAKLKGLLERVACQPA